MSESRRAELWARWYAIADHPSPLVKQSPTAIAQLIALGLCLTVPELRFEYPIVAWLGVARIAMGWPLAAVAALVTYLAIRKAQRALREAGLSEQTSTDERLREGQTSTDESDVDGTNDPVHKPN